jgi:hypothetical protein
VLTGSITANQSGSIAQVETLFSGCGVNNTAQSSGTVAPIACPASSVGSGGFVLTSATQSSATPVQAGQLIQVTVTITLS